MTVYLYTGGTRQVLIDPIVSVGGTIRPVEEVWAYSAGRRDLVFKRQALEVTATATAWDVVAVSWIPPGSGADDFVVKRNGTVIATGPITSLTDYLRNPSTTYTYTVEAYRGGSLISTASDAAVTPARADLGLSVSAASWDRMNVSWTDPSGGSIDQYRVTRNGSQIYLGTAKSITDTGLSESTGYSYVVEARRSGAVIAPTDSASGTTQARPTSGLIGISQLTRNSWQWRQSSAPSRIEASFTMPRQGYIRQFRLQAQSHYGSSAGSTYYTPIISNSGGGVLINAGQQNVGKAGSSDTGWSQFFSGGDVSLGAGTYRIGFIRNTGYPTQWDEYTSAGSTLYYDNAVHDSSGSILFEILWWYYL